jgi:signal transduction histidine kinase
MPQKEKLRASAAQLRRLVARLNSVREDEARRIARELHDDLGQQLTVLIMQLSELEAKLRPMEPSLEERLTEMHRLAQGLIEEVRKISGGLRLGQLDHLGLTAAIESQLEVFRRRSDLRCVITRLDESGELPDSVATAAFRIFQEALTNISRHSGANQVEVALVLSEDRLSLEVRDNGRGITAAQSADDRACGLLGMRERAEALDGRVEISGSPGEGTVVRVELPLRCGVGVGR